MPYKEKNRHWAKIGPYVFFFIKHKIKERKWEREKAADDIRLDRLPLKKNAKSLETSVYTGINLGKRLTRVH
jgi:hypothetical protein